MLLLWLDLETTGLDPRNDRILEVAWAIATLERPFDVGPIRSFVLSLPRRSMPPFVIDMHTKNGLLNECKTSTFCDGDAEAAMCVQVPDVEDREERAVLAGFSVHFDLGFLRQWMPLLARRLSHRVYDVSAVKLFLRSLGMPKPPKEEAHRAEPDVRASVEQARQCARWLGR